MYLIKNENVLTYINYLPVYKGLNLVEFGEERNSRQLRQTIHRDNYIIHFVLQGKGLFCHNGKKYPLVPGKAFVITPQALVDYGAESGTEWEYCWIAFSGIDCSVLFDQCGLNKEVAVFDFSPEEIAPLTDLIEQVRRNDTVNTSVFPFRAEAMGFSVLGNLSAKFNVSVPKKQGLSSSIVDASIKYMQMNLGKPITVSSLCKELNVSRSYFSTLFESVMKQPPYRYLQNLRLKRAAELLLQNPDLRIYEIAEEVGFSSTAQFCKSFYRTCRSTPTQFRTMYQSTEEYDRDKRFQITDDRN